MAYFVSFYFFLVFISLTVQGEAHKEKEVCLSCHAQPGLHTIVPYGQTVSMFINIEETNQSAHSSLSCADYHQEVEKYAVKKGHLSVTAFPCSERYNRVLKMFFWILIGGTALSTVAFILIILITKREKNDKQ